MLFRITWSYVLRVLFPLKIGCTWTIIMKSIIDRFSIYWTSMHHLVVDNLEKTLSSNTYSISYSCVIDIFYLALNVFYFILLPSTVSIVVKIVRLI